MWFLFYLIVLFFAPFNHENANAGGNFRNVTPDIEFGEVMGGPGDAGGGECEIP